MHVTEPDQRQQEPARGGARQPGGAGNVAQPQLRRVRPEGLDDGEAALERLDIVGISPLLGIHHVNACSHTERPRCEILAP
jgi:hypothetical protein